MWANYRMMKNTILSALGFPKPAELQRSSVPWSELGAEPKILDCRQVKDSSSLKQIAFQLKTELQSLGTNEAIILVGSLPQEGDPASKRIHQHALTGMMKSVAKEIGHKGQRINLLRLPADVDLNTQSVPFRFFGSGRSSFITGQTLDITNETSSGSPAGKVCLVTGGSRGIGAACVSRLLKEECKVIIVDMPSSKNTASDLIEAGAEFYGCDVTDLSSMSSTLASILGIHGKVDMLVNNAGITRDKTLKRMPEEYWDQLIAVNLQAVLNITDHLLAVQGMEDNGRIINMSSISGIGGNFGQTNYTAAKAAVIEMAASYADHVSEKSITINAIAPGFILTDMVKSMPMMTKIAAERLTCLAQAGTPEDIAEAVTFLAHPGAQGINGQVLRVCGGSFLGA